MPGSTDIIVKVAAVKGAYGSERPNGQFMDWGAGVTFVLKQAQYGVLHQMLGIGSGPDGDLRNLRFLLWREMYFHPFKTTRKPTFWQHRYRRLLAHNAL